MPFFKLTKFQRHRLSLFFLCLTAAAVSWVFFALSNRSEYSVNTTVKYINVPQNKAFHPLQPDNVQIVAEGSGWQLLFSKMRITPKYLQVDLSTLNKQNFVILKNQLRVINSDFEEGQKIMSIYPDTLYFDFSSRSIKKVPVTLVSKILFKNQYGVYDNVQLLPDSVTLTGASADLKQITSWQTDTLKLTNVEASVQATITLRQPSKSNISIFPPQVSVKMPVDEFTEKVIEVPLKVKNNVGFEEVMLLPESVKIKLMVSLKNYPLVDKKSLDASVNLENWRNNQFPQLPVKINRFPKFCQLISVDPQSAAFIIQK